MDKKSLLGSAAFHSAQCQKKRRKPGRGWGLLEGSFSLPVSSGVERSNPINSTFPTGIVREALFVFYCKHFPRIVPSWFSSRPQSLGVVIPHG